MSRHNIQRELSWNAFNARVLHEGLREDNGLLDRLNFIAITSANYDEFFKVRVARIIHDIKEGDYPYPADGRRPSDVLSTLLRAVREVVAKQHTAFRRDILPELAKKGMIFLPPNSWGPDGNAMADRIFENELYPISTPIALSEVNSIIGHAAQEKVYAAFSIEDGSITFVRVPENLKRFRFFRVTPDRWEIVLIEDILLSHGEAFFPGQQLKFRCLFRITRDAGMTVDEKKDEDFISAMEEVLEYRKVGFPVRLETFGDEELACMIREEIELSEASHFHLSIPLNLKGFFTLVNLPVFDCLRKKKSSPRIPLDISDSDDLWNTLKNKDILLHHPYESYAPVIRMVELAASDSATLAIKMTLYRTSGDSPIVEALIHAAESGIQVTVLVELKARFDENANIHWAFRLKKAGAIVMYGLVGLKVHAKALMVVRREDSGIRRYLHLSTGNYNDSTARLYTDIGLITSRDNFTRDAALIFNTITGYSTAPRLCTLFMAPFSLRRETLRLIQRETKRAKAGEDARIIAKMNALVDEEIIEALYEASMAGVKIDLNIRGICCLRPGVKGLSKNIRVISVIDGFLEHTRIFVYENGGNKEVFLSSADWMTRSMNRRIELLFPIPDATHKKRIMKIIKGYFKDNTRSWELKSDGHWEMKTPGKEEKPFRIQEYLAKSAAHIARGEEDSMQQTLLVRHNFPVI